MDVNLKVRGDVEALRLHPGDKIVVTSELKLTDEQGQSLFEAVQRWAGDEYPVIVVHGGITIASAGRAEEPAVG